MTIHGLARTTITLDIDIPSDAPNGVLADHLQDVADLSGDIAHSLLSQMTADKLDAIDIHSSYLRLRGLTTTTIDKLRTGSHTPERLGKMNERDYRTSMDNLIRLFRQHMSAIQIAALAYQDIKDDMFNAKGDLKHTWVLRYKTAINQTRQTAEKIGRYRAWWRAKKGDVVDTAFAGNM